MTSTGDDIEAKTGRWTFGGKVVKNFDDHIKKSVPGYEEGHDLVAKLAPFFLGENESKFLEIGCSTGLLTKKVRQMTERSDVEFIGIDIEKDMVNYANENNKFSNVKFELANIKDYEISNFNIISSYYTLQFINPSIRQILVDKIFQSLKWGGAFI